MAFWDKLKVKSFLDKGKPIVDSTVKLFDALFKFIGSIGYFSFQNLENKQLLKAGYGENKHINAMINWKANQSFRCIKETGRYYKKDKEGNLIPLEYKENKELMDVIKNPYIYDFKEFIRGLVVFYVSEGELVIYKKYRYKDDVKIGNPVIGIGILAPHDLAIIGGGTFEPIAGFRHINFSADFTAKEIIFKRNFNPFFETNGSQLRGFSPLKPIENEIQLSKKGIETLGAIANNQGVRAIVSPKMNPSSPFLDKEQSILMREAFAERTKGVGKEGDLAFFNTEMTVKDLGMKPTELQILEQEDKFIGWFANTLDLDQHLFGVVSSGHDGIAKEANKTSITKGVLPIVELLEDCFSEIGQSYYDNEEIVFKCSPKECFEELQDDKKSNSDISANANGLSVNERRALLGQQPDPNPISDIPLVKTGFIFADEIGQTPDNQIQKQTDGTL